MNKLWEDMESQRWRLGTRNLILTGGRVFPHNGSQEPSRLCKGVYKGSANSCFLKSFYLYWGIANYTANYSNAKECAIYHTVALISHASKVVFKILQARLQQYVNHEFPDVQAGFRKGRGTRDQVANIRWTIE